MPRTNFILLVGIKLITITSKVTIKQTEHILLQHNT